MSIILQNLSSRPITLAKGKVVAKLGAANAIPDMLAPEVNGKIHEGPNETQKGETKAKDSASPEWLDKFFSKLQLDGSKSLTEQQQNEAKSCLKNSIIYLLWEIWNWVKLI